MKKPKPTTPSQRATLYVSYRDFLTTSKPHKKLTKGGKDFAGRSSSGRISVRHQGGGHKRKFRMIYFVYDKKDIPAKVETIEYDPYRSGFIALVLYRDGERRYVLAPLSLKKGREVITSEQAPVEIGNRL